MDQTQQMLETWLRGSVSFTREVVANTVFGPGHNYIDLHKVNGQYSGTSLIRFCKTVLANEILPLPMIREIAPLQGYEVVMLPAKQMIQLRALLRANGEIDISRAKGFRQFLRGHRSRFPQLNHHNPLVNLARAINAMQHEGRMTHVIIHPASRFGGLRLGKGGDGGDIKAFYATADEGLLDLMKHPDPKSMRLMEI